MNMISIGAFQNEVDASKEQPTLAEKFASVWEKKNAKAARAGGVSLMALSLAACGSDDTTATTTATSTSTDTTTTTTTVTALSASLTVGNDVVTGTSADDSISGARIDTVQTLTGGDSIDGGAGTDTLTAVITAGFTPSEGGIKNVENLQITNVNGTNGAETIIFSTATVTSISGVTSITNVGSDAEGDLTLTRLVENPSFTLNNVQGDTTVTYSAAALAGTADTLDLTVNGSTSAVNFGAGGAGFETVKLTGNGSTSTFSLANVDSAATAVTVHGSALLDIDAADAFPKLATFDASDSSGGVRIAFGADTVTGSTNTKTITGSSGKDILDIDQVAAATVGAVTLDAGAGDDTVVIGAQGGSDYTISGGDGVDILSIATNAAAATHAGVSGFEKLYVTAGATQNMALLTQQTNTFTHVRMDAASVTVTNAPGTVTDLQITDNNATLASFDRLVDGSANSLSIYASAANTATTLTVDDEETLTFSSADAAITITNFNAEDATSITIAGDNAIDLGTYAATTANLATFDASGMTSAANATLVASASTTAMTVTGNAGTSYTGILTVTTGNANDTITGGNGADVITAGAGNDTIVGGVGADTITGGAGADTITGGGGVDIFVFTQPSAQANSIDTIKDFTANSTNTSDDRISIDIKTGAGVDATSMHAENSGGEVLDEGDVYVLTGDVNIDVSGNAAADLTAIKAAGGGLTISSADGVEALAIFKADTNGDGTANEVQLWLLESTAANATINKVYHLATFEGYSVTADLTGDFAVGDFDI